MCRPTEWQRDHGEEEDRSLAQQKACAVPPVGRDAHVFESNSESVELVLEGTQALRQLVCSIDELGGRIRQGSGGLFNPKCQVGLHREGPRVCNRYWVPRERREEAREAHRTDRTLGGGKVERDGP